MFMELRERMVSMRPFEPDKVAMAELTMKLRGMGVTDTRLLRALELVPRRMFVAAAHQASAYLDRSLPIECGQTINAPSTVALMVSALAVEPGHKVLEVGCGSGFQAAILAHLAAQVVTMDRFRSLIDIAEDRLTALKITNVITLLGDGLEGFTRYAPYDRILLDGAVEKVPTALLDQLADRGILVAPVGVGHTQTLVRISRDVRHDPRPDVQVELCEFDLRDFRIGVEYALRIRELEVGYLSHRLLVAPAARFGPQVRHVESLAVILCG